MPHVTHPLFSDVPDPDPAPAASGGMPRLADCLRELQRCGWAPVPLQPNPAAPPIAEIEFQTFQGTHIAPVALLQAGGGAQLLLIALEAVHLPAQEELFARLLELPLETRLALTAARRLSHAGWMLLVTAGRAELFRLTSETCECRALDERECAEGLWPALAALGRGRNDAATEGTRRGMPAAEALRDWLRQWAGLLAPTLDLPAERCEDLLWQWLLLLQVARRAEGLTGGPVDTAPVADGWGLTCEPLAATAGTPARWRVAYDALSSTADLSRALELYPQFFETRLLPPVATTVRERLEALDDSSILDRLRAELLMHAQESFEPETVAWLYTDLAREAEGWRRELAGIEPMRRRLQHEGWQVFQPILCDVGQHGLSAALREAERLADYLEELALYQRSCTAGGRFTALVQPDLFMASPRGISFAGELVDGVNYLLGVALRLRGVAPERRAQVGRLFLLKALALAEKHQWPFLGIDTLDALFTD